MKCYIKISGQAMGNGKLWRSLGANAFEGKDGNYGTRYFLYDTVKDAKIDLMDAYKSLKFDEPDYGGIEMGFKNESLYYDASKAELIKERY